MPRDAHNKAAEHHENAAKSHKMAAEHHGRVNTARAVRNRRRPMAIRRTLTNIPSRRTA
jgi:hypothetical protein